MTYDNILRTAEARTFHLERKLRVHSHDSVDSDIEEVLSSPVQAELFEQ